MSCPSCQSSMGPRQKVCGSCGWTKGEQTGPECDECRDSNPSKRWYHWLSLSPFEVDGHLSWISDKITKSILVNSIQTTRTRYSGVMTDRFAVVEPCDAWKSAMIAAQREREEPFESYKREWVKTNGKRPGESRSQHLRRILNASGMYAGFQGLVKAAEASEKRIDNDLYGDL